MEGNHRLTTANVLIVPHSDDISVYRRAQRIALLREAMFPHRLCVADNLDKLPDNRTAMGYVIKFDLLILDSKPKRLRHQFELPYFLAKFPD